MKKALYLLSLTVLFFSCGKEETETMTIPSILLDQAKVETALVGSWQGQIKESTGLTEAVEVSIEQMLQSKKVAEGIYVASAGSCGFEWTYESFNTTTGRVTFREKTLAPNVCFDNVAVLGHFYSNDLDALNLTIEIENFLWKGTLAKQ